MNRRYALPLVILLVAGASMTTLAQKKPAGGGNTLFPVNADFRCPADLATCPSPDKIQGDGLGTYRGTTPTGSATTSEGLASNMGGYFTEANLFLFVLKSGLGRSISFNFADGTAPCTGPVKCRKNFSYAVSDVSLPGGRTYPVDASGNDLRNGFMDIPVGQSANARILINFADPTGRAILWTVRFDPRLYPGSTYLRVTRTAENLWVIEADSTHTAGLESANTSGKVVKVNEGYYKMPFRITVTK